MNVKGNGTTCLPIVEKDGRYTTLSLPCEVSRGGNFVVAPPYKTSNLDIKGDLPPLMDMTNLIPNSRFDCPVSDPLIASHFVYRP